MSNNTSPDLTDNNDNPYGYTPTFWICVTFITLFGITTAIHLGQALLIKPRQYWLIPTTVLCGIGEILGWSGRLWSNKNLENGNAFMIQITCTIIAPVFLTAAMYNILGLIIVVLGNQYSRLKPKTYLKIFVATDIFSLVVQAVGGAIASIAKTNSASNLGSNILLAGIIIQTVGLVCYTILAFEVILRFWFKKPLSSGPAKTTSSSQTSISEDVFKTDSIESQNDTPAVFSTKIKLMVLALALVTVLVFIRTFYRTVELSGGWQGRIIRTQIYFNVLDATPICLALFVFNVFPPSILLGREGVKY
ncbi:hypothetical protein M422DRAFT_210772 [Sphaerobolus stellatus SS14]|uniref:RTA1-domain-containing protein n=1 Tax=Sphaerobolus stellatus (strain SS14) TaxID=990650 RepID=A0A0C9U6U7_SPHS4|nr:hypothetical protein M422DRAFT_210772 [Sphaerobolus stellatus SS14]